MEELLSKSADPDARYEITSTTICVCESLMEREDAAIASSSHTHAGMRAQDKWFGTICTVKPSHHLSEPGCDTRNGNSAQSNEGSSIRIWTFSEGLPLHLLRVLPERLIVVVRVLRMTKIMHIAQKGV
jgi:hypothetical protein